MKTAIITMITDVSILHPRLDITFPMLKCGLHLHLMKQSEFLVFWYFNRLVESLFLWHSSPDSSPKNPNSNSRRKSGLPLWDWLHDSIAFNADRSSAEKKSDFVHEIIKTSIQSWHAHRKLHHIEWSDFLIANQIAQK